MRARLPKTVSCKFASLLLWHWRLMSDLRWWKASFIAVVMWVLGWYLVHLWVSKLGTEATLVRNAVSVTMIYPTYRIHRWLWKDRGVFPKLGRRWSKTWAQLFCAHWAVYWLAIHPAGMPYMKAGLVLSIPFTLLGFWRRDGTDFAIKGKIKNQ
jgi:hypothetical protein